MFPLNPSKDSLSAQFQFLNDKKFRWLSKIERELGILPPEKPYCQELDQKQKELDSEILKLQDEGKIYYSAAMNREQAEGVLQNQKDGVFLIRNSSQKNQGRHVYVLSTILDNKIYHNKIELDDHGKISIYPTKHDSLQEYLDFAMKSNLLTMPYIPPSS